MIKSAYASRIAYISIEKVMVMVESDAGQCEEACGFLRWLQHAGDAVQRGGRYDPHVPARPTGEPEPAHERPRELRPAQGERTTPEQAQARLGVRLSWQGLPKQSASAADRRGRLLRRLGRRALQHRGALPEALSRTHRRCQMVCVPSS